MLYEGTEDILDGGDYERRGPHRAPLLFNTIDTSNLANHLGLLNLLVVALPLLRKTPLSVLYTNALVTTDDTGGSPAGFAYRACADIRTLSLLLDVFPVSYASGSTSHPNTHETR